ncbi:SusC/RagA family TonB-linked outer membrane protein [Bacteroides sedimenti]
MKVEKQTKYFSSLKRVLALALIVLTTLPVIAQNITVKGNVKDASGDPVIGASVVLQGTSTGTMTDIDGNYVLNKVPSKGKLVFSYIGMKAQTVNVNGQTVINIELTADSKLLDEIVVVGYGTQKKVNVTGAVSTVSAKTLENRPVQNVSQALQGVVPGLNFSVNNSGGTLDNTMNVNIRGTGTVGQGSSSSPLILIDGVEGNMNALNPADIENISVLKDAASSAIYGARAAFGVILITTKSGSQGKARVNYSANVRYTDAVQIPEMLDSYRFAQYFNVAAANSGQSPVFSAETMQRIQDYQAGKITAGTTVGSNGLWQNYTGANANTNWFKEMYKDWVPSQEHNVSMNGGTDKVNYFVSGNFLDQNGLIRHGKDEFQRYSVNAKITAKLSEKVEMTYNSKWIREDYSRPTYMTGLFFHNIARRWPTNPVRDPNGFYMEGNEVVQMEEGGKQTRQTDYLYQQLKLTISPIKDWKIYLEGNYNTREYYTHWDVLPVYGYKPDGSPYATSWNGGPAGYSESHEDAYKQNYFTTNMYTDYTKTFASGHSFKVMAGFNAELLRNRDISGTRADLITPNVTAISTATNKTPSVSGGYNEWAVAGFFGRLNYNFKERYLFEANVRRDGSSRYVGNKRWGTFPSFSAGWNIAREDFWGDMEKTIGTLKLRASWGQLGNMNTNSWYPFFLTMPVSTNPGSSWLIESTRYPYATAPGIVSNALTWETIESWDAGLDWSAFGNRFTGTFDVFVRKTKDMVGPAPELSSVLGTGVPKINNADMKSYGWELELSWRDRIGDFNYGVKGVIADAQQEITRFPNPSYTLGSSTYYVGQKLGEIWGYTTVGIAKSQKEMDDHLALADQKTMGAGWAAGDIMYADINGDGKVNSGQGTLYMLDAKGDFMLDENGKRISGAGDMKIIGNNTPRYNYGITLDCSWKGFDFSAFFQGVGKRDYWLDGPYFQGASGGMWQSCGFKQHWDFFRPENDPLGANLDSYFPRPLFTNSGKNYAVQTRYLQNAAYIRLKNIQFGYSLPKQLMEKVKMNSVRFYVSGDNLWTKSDITGIFDPETLGGDWGPGKLYPLSKTISFGVNVNF